MTFIDEIVSDYIKTRNKQCLENLKLDSVEKEEKHFKKHVIYEGYMNLEQVGIPSCKAKIVFDPEYCTLNFGIYCSNQLKYYLPIEIDECDLRKL